MQLAPDINSRTTKRGLLIATPFGDTLLLQCAQPSGLVEFLHQDPSAEALAHRIGGPDAENTVLELQEMGILVDSQNAGPHGPSRGEQSRTWQLTRSGLEFAGIERPARWIQRRILPMINSVVGRIATATIIVLGLLSFFAGRPGPAVSSSPALDALLGIAIGLLAAAAHELAHAVALVHYGRTPRRAGFGFYWGSICFYVDSTDAVTLPRRQRIVQALAGLAVDVVVVCTLATVAQASSSVLLAAVCWRLAVVGVVDLVINGLPILQLDGHWALSDWLDEPELALTSRNAFRDALRRRPRTAPRWMAAYGALSLFGGIVLTVGGALVWWAAAHELVIALFTGTIGELLIGLYLVVPVLIGGHLSCLGLLRELLPAKDVPDEEVIT
jgi:hypothetical protein